MKSFTKPSLAILASAFASILFVAGCGGGETIVEPLDLGPDAIVGDGGRDGALPDGALPDGTVLPDGAMPDGTVLPDGAMPDGGMMMMPGITVSPTMGLSTTELGGTDTFTVVLDSMPTDDVVIAISSSDATEGTAAPATLTFTTANWNAPQVVTVTGVDDLEADGTVDYNIVTANAVSADSDYSGRAASDVMVRNIDNETAGITVEPTSGLSTTESGDTDTFTIVLNTQPEADVTIALSSSLATEATVSPDSVTFTTTNWNSAQTITVTGADDFSADGNRDFTIVTAAAVSSDADYMGIDADDVTGTNLDNETPGIIIDPVEGLTTTEAGGTATVTIVLQSQPAEDVSIPVASSDETEGTIGMATVVFTTTNWDVPQAIVVTGQNDDVADGNQTFHITTGPATSADPGYMGLSGTDSVITNIDDETAGVTLNPTDGLTTTEAGGTATFTIVLNSAPSADVNIALTSTDETEGTVDPASLVFTTADWNIPQTVTVTGVDDAIADGPGAFQINAATSSSDADYQALADLRADVTNTDDETAGVTVNPTTGLTTTEAGGTTTFTVVLNSEPTADVTFAISSDDTALGTVDVASLTFTATDWNVPQTITATGVDNLVADGSKIYHVVIAAAVSDDSGYSGLDPDDVAITNTDNDVVGLTVAPPSISVTEAGTTGTFTVVLTSQPTADVTIPLSVVVSSRANTVPSSVVFTTSDWNVPQTVTVSAVDDAIANGDITTAASTNAATSTDLSYNGYDGPNVNLMIADNDMASIVVTPTSGLSVTEAGSTATFTVVLTSQPTSTVTIGLSSSDTTEGTVTPASLLFDETNWNTPQTVTVTGADDSAVDGPVAYTIVTAVPVSSDTSYDGLAAADVSVTTTDNDTAGVTVTPTTGLVTSEAGGSATFTVVLGAQPSADVTITLSSTNTAEGTVAPSMLTFTNANWNVPQTVTVTGVDDFGADGSVSYTITTSATASADSAFSGVAVADVSVSNSDNDVPGVTVSPTSGLMTSEGLTSTTFTIVLATQPSAAVSIALSSSNVAEGTVSPAMVNFTNMTWNMPQTVTVTGVDDMTADGPIGYTIVTGNSVSTDGGYSGLTVSDVSVTNLDNDVAPTFSSTLPTVGTLVAGVDTFTPYTPSAIGTPSFPPGVITATGLPTWMTFDGVAPAACPMQTFTAGTLAGCSPVPAASFGSYSVTLTANNGIAPNATQNIAFTVIAPPPTLTSITPALARRQATVPVTIRGLSFSTIGAVTAVQIRLGSGGTPISLAGFSVVDANTITVTIPADGTRTAGTYDVIVVQSGISYVLARALNVTSGTDGTLVSGNITFDTTWPKAGSPYLVSGSISIQNGATLTIAPGTTVIMGTSGTVNNGLRFDVGVAGAGNLVANGGDPATSGEPIVFTSYQPLAGMPAGGKWGNIRIGAMAGPTTVLRNVVVEYGNREANGYLGAVEVQANAVFGGITDSIIRESDRAGLWIGSTVQTLPATVINTSTISRNAIGGGGTYYPIVVAADSVPTLGSTMTWSLNQRDQIQVTAGTISRGDSSSQNVWKRFSGIDYISTGTVTVQNNITLSIAAGNTVKFPFNTFIDVGGASVGGLSIDAATNAVTLTSSSAVAGQEWSGVRFRANAGTSLMRGVNVTNFNNQLAGGIRLLDPTGGDTVTTAVVTIDQCNITSAFAGSVGLYMDANARVVGVTNTTFDAVSASVSTRVDDLHTVMATTNVYKTQLIARTGTIDITRNAVDATVWPKVVNAMGSAQTINLAYTTITSTSLNISGGNVLALGDNVSIDVTNAKLLLSGTVTQPITIKSTNPGTIFWDRLRITGKLSGTTDSTITYTTFQNGGYDVAAVNTNIAYILCDCTGTVCATPVLQNNTLTGSNGFGMSFQPSGTFGYSSYPSGSFTGNTITGSRFSPINITANWVSRMTSTNAFTGNNTTASAGYYGVRVNVGNHVFETQTWPALNASDTSPFYSVASSLLVLTADGWTTSRTVLTLAAGADVRFPGGTISAGQYFQIGYTAAGYALGSELVTAGTMTNPVRITTWTGDATAGYWRGIVYDTGSGVNSTNSYVTVSYGGSTAGTGLGNIEVRNAGITGAKPVFMNSTFSNSENYAGRVNAAVCTPVMSGMTYTGNLVGNCIRQNYGASLCIAAPSYP